LEIEIYRDRNVFGSLEIGRLFLELEEKTIPERSGALRSRSTNRLTKALRTEPKKIRQFSRDNSKFESKKSIAFIVPYQIYGGAEVYLKNIINNAEPDKYNIHILYMKNNPLQNHIILKNVNHRVVRGFDQLAGIVKSNNYDHIVYYNRADIYKILSSLKSKDIISSKLIEIYHSDFVWTGSISTIKERKSIDKIITVGKSLALDITGISKGNREVVPVGIDLEKFSIRNSDIIKKQLGIDSGNRPIIGTVARLSKEKNIGYVVKLANLMKDFYFVIVGSGNQRQEIESKIKNLGLENIKLVGFKEDVNRYYNIFDAFLLPSLIEGTPISILEAMSSGVPVFTSMVGAIPDIVKEGETGFGLIGVPEKDAKKIKENIFDLEVVSRAKRYVDSNHNIKKNADMFFKVIASLDSYFTELKSTKNIIVLSGEYI
jgi:glycosyltransferase involved in cell wall biosynthesis